MAEKILIVDDEETLCEVLRFNLEAEGYEAEIAYSGEQALSMSPENYSLILLDIMMDGISGIQMANILKGNPLTANIPIIFCTAKSSEEDMVHGLHIGADDYITKPYSIRNVLARVQAVLRRTGNSSDTNADHESVSYKGLKLFPNRKICLVDNNEVKLPRKEFEILLTLLSNRGKLFSREDLLHRIWPDEVIVLNRVVDVNITRIRQKIGEYGKNIVTRPGYGYVFVE